MEYTMTSCDFLRFALLASLVTILALFYWVFWLVKNLTRCYPSPPYLEDELDHYCGECGHHLQLVRPGKWQCPRCE